LARSSDAAGGGACNCAGTPPAGEAAVCAINCDDGTNPITSSRTDAKTVEEVGFS
jgi:hypothetical protein